jgi:hypothetical protein
MFQAGVNDSKEVPVDTGLAFARDANESVAVQGRDRDSS